MMTLASSQMRAAGMALPEALGPMMARTLSWLMSFLAMAAAASGLSSLSSTNKVTGYCLSPTLSPPGVDFGRQQLRGLLTGIAHGGLAAGDLGIDADSDVVGFFGGTASQGQRTGQDHQGDAARPVHMSVSSLLDFCDMGPVRPRPDWHPRRLHSIREALMRQLERKPRDRQA